MKVELHQPEIVDGKIGRTQSGSVLWDIFPEKSGIFSGSE
jgi:hypothetical protein